MPKNKSLSVAAEWRWVFGIASLFLLLSSLPYWAGYRAQTDEFVFSGSVFNRLDVDAHLAAMQLGAQGAWQQQLRFTSEPHEGAYIRMAYVLMGQAAAALGMSVPVAFQVFRLSFGLLACLGLTGRVGGPARARENHRPVFQLVVHDPCPQVGTIVLLTLGVNGALAGTPCDSVWHG